MQKGFSLIELMIVVAIIGILAIIAFPVYQDYTKRVYVAEAIHFVNTSKLDMTEHFVVDGVVNDEGNYFYPDIKYVREIFVSGHAIVIVFEEELAGTGAWTELNFMPMFSEESVPMGSSIFKMGNEGSLEWLCYTSFIDDPMAVPRKYLPSSCLNMI